MQDGIVPDHGSGYQHDRPGASARRAHRPGDRRHPTWARGPELRALGAAVRELRARRGLSQEALGFRADLHRNYVGGIERGELNATFRILLNLAHGLDVPLSEIIATYERNRMAQLGIVPPAPAPGQTSGSREAAGPPSVIDAGAAGSDSADPAPGGSPTRRAPRRSAEPPAPRLRLLRSGTPTRPDLIR